MATRTAKLRVELDGEKQYKQALSELNKGNQVLASEMRKLSAEYKNNDKSVEALTKRGDVLERQLLQQKDKVQTLRDALANAAKQYGEADKRTQDWQIKLNDAEAAQYKLEHAIEENNAEIKKQDQAMVEEGKTVGKLGDQVQDLAGKLGIRLPQSAKKALNGMQGFSAGTVAAMGAAAAAVAGLIKTVKALNDMTIEAAGRADTLLTESVKSGLSVGQLQAINYASPFIDVDTSTFTGTLERMPKLLSDAQEQMNKYAEAQLKAAEDGKECTATLGAQAQAFLDLGISVENSDGSLRGANETMWAALEALNQMGDTTEANALANDLFGKSYADLKPLIQNTAEAQRLMNEAVEEGYVLSEAQIKILGAVDDQVQKNQLTFEQYKNKIAVEFAPASVAAMEAFRDVVQKAGQTLIDTRMIENLGAVVQSISGIVKAGTDLASAIPKWMNPIQQVSNALRGLSLIAATVADAMTILAGLLPKNWGSGMIKQGLGLNLSTNDLSKMSYRQQIKYGSGDYTFYNAAGTDNWRGGLTWVGEAGPELVSLPRGSAIYSNQESRAIAATGTDTSRLEALMERNVQILEQISGEFSGLRVKGRMV